MKPVQEYWPPILQAVKEFKEIASAENPELQRVWQSVNELINDQFIETATERGIARHEKMLKLKRHPEDNLEARRFRILTRWNDRLPYTYQVLVSRLEQLFGDNYSLELLYNHYTLNIDINTFDWHAFNELIDDFRFMIPANMVLQPMQIQKLKSPVYYASALMAGEEITIYPWSSE